MIDEKTKAIISAAVILTVQVLTLFNVNLTSDVLYKMVMIFVSICATAWAIWKNHNFTDAAVQAQKFLDEMKKL